MVMFFFLHFFPAPIFLIINIKNYFPSSVPTIFLSCKFKEIMLFFPLFSILNVFEQKSFGAVSSKNI